MAQERQEIACTLAPGSAGPAERGGAVRVLTQLCTGLPAPAPGWPALLGRARSPAQHLDPRGTAEGVSCSISHCRTPRSSAPPPPAWPEPRWAGAGCRAGHSRWTGWRAAPRHRRPAAARARRAPCLPELPAAACRAPGRSAEHGAAQTASYRTAQNSLVPARTPEGSKHLHFCVLHTQRVFSAGSHPSDQTL